MTEQPENFFFISLNSNCDVFYFHKHHILSIDFLKIIFQTLKQYFLIYKYKSIGRVSFDVSIHSLQCRLHSDACMYTTLICKFLFRKFPHVNCHSLQVIAQRPSIFVLVCDKWWFRFMLKCFLYYRQRFMLPSFYNANFIHQLEEMVWMLVIEKLYIFCQGTVNHANFFFISVYIHPFLASNNHSLTHWT